MSAPKPFPTRPVSGGGSCPPLSTVLHPNQSASSQTDFSTADNRAPVPHSGFEGKIVVMEQLPKGTKDLPEQWAQYLLRQPETGMDYQVVRIELTDGGAFDDVIIIHSHIIASVRGHSAIPFEPGSIVRIDVTHNKWDWNSKPDSKSG